MKLLITTLILFLLILSRAQGLEFSLGLNTEAPALREKPVLLIYFSNDRMAPVQSAKMTQVNGYLSSGLKGQQTYISGSSMGVFRPEELAFYNQLAEDDRNFLSSLGEYSVSDSSEHATANEYGAILENVARKNPKYRMGFVFFRNFLQPRDLDLTIDFNVEHLAPGSETNSWQTYHFPNKELPKDATDFPYGGQPLSHPAVFERLMQVVYELYPPDNYRYVLVIKSQGGDGLAFAPRFDTFPQTETDYRTLLTQLLKEKETLLQGEKNLPYHRGTNTRLSRILNTLAGKKERAGITQKQVLDTLAKGKGSFPLVFFDVNELDFPESIQQSGIYPGIGRVFYTNRSVPYDLIDYNDLFSYIGVTATDFEIRFRDLLQLKLLN